MEKPTDNEIAGAAKPTPMQIAALVGGTALLTYETYKQGRRSVPEGLFDFALGAGLGAYAAFGVMEIIMRD